MSTVAGISLADAEQFLYREARYADSHAFEAWEALWTDDAVYWVPANGEDTDPTLVMSVIFDNRARISTRIKQFGTGKRHAATPPSRLRRMVTNVELAGPDPEREDQVVVLSNFLVVESRERGQQLWAGYYEHRLREEGGELRMAYKKAVLIDNDRPLHTLSFLI